MIKSLHIECFQSHKDSVLKFHPGVNIVVGSSDSGKSAIIRAIGWVVNNRPSGSSFKSSWGGETKVSLSTSEGQEIVREKGNENLYVVNNLIDTQVLKAFGQDVPQEVSKIINISQLNIQSQLDPPFLLSSSPGEVAQLLNQIVHLEVIDVALSNSSKRVRDIQQDIKVKETDLAKTKEQISGYSYLLQMEQDILGLEGCSFRLEAAKKQVDNINSSTLEIEQLAQQLSKLSNVEEALSSMEILSAKAEEILGKKSGLVGLTLMIQNIQVVKRKLDMLVEVDDALTAVSLLFNQVELVEKKKKGLAAITSITRDIQDMSSSILSKAEEGKLLQAEFTKKMPKVCPLCGSSTNTKEVKCHHE